MRGWAARARRQARNRTCPRGRRSGCRLSVSPAAVAIADNEASVRCQGGRSGWVTTPSGWRRLALSCPSGGQKDGEEKHARPGPALGDAFERKGRVAGRQMGEEAEGDEVIDMGRQAGKGEGGVFDQVSLGQTVRIGQFDCAAAQHQGAAGIGCVVMAGVKVRHRLAAQPQRPRADIEKPMAGLHPMRREQR